MPVAWGRGGLLCPCQGARDPKGRWAWPPSPHFPIPLCHLWVSSAPTPCAPSGISFPGNPAYKPAGGFGQLPLPVPPLQSNGTSLPIWREHSVRHCTLSYCPPCHLFSMGRPRHSHRLCRQMAAQPSGSWGPPLPEGQKCCHHPVEMSLRKPWADRAGAAGGELEA